MKILNKITNIGLIIIPIWMIALIVIQSIILY